ncbi:MAG: response regulator, partial [Methylococcales bacterium]
MLSVLEQRETELKEARDAALEIAKVKAEFAAVVSHEIRTPLNGVLGMLNLLNEGVDPERQKEYLNVAISSGDTLMALINDILDFSKIDAGKLEVDVTDFNLRDVLEEVAALFSEKAQSKDIELSLDIPPDLPRMVAGDVTRLRQILNNLLSNAIKFTDYGEVILSVRFQELEGFGIRADFAVRDTGIGIPGEAKERIFELFRQADTGITRKFGGAGLGLAISKRLVELLGGRLLVESSPGEGSTFSFSAQLGVKEAANPDRCFIGQRLIIAVKNPSTAGYLKNTLESFGCECRNGRTEQEVLSASAEFVEDRRLVICLLDPAMCDSEYSGFIRNIREIGETEERIKIVILTRPYFYVRDPKNIEATLDKPVRLSALKRVIRQIIQGMGPKSIPGDLGHNIQSLRASRQGRILIVDDNRTNQLVAKAMLGESGYQTDIAADGQEAVSMVTGQDYDLVLMDCNMPVMDGYDATLKIRSLHGKPGRVPIFAMTAVDNPNDFRRCLDVGMNDILIKPIRLADLRKKIAKLFDQEQDLLERMTSAKAFSIDDDSFDNLVKAIGHKVSEIIDAFFGDTPNYLDQLGIALRSRDWARLKSVTHSLKGSSNNLGANILGSICREIEELVNEKEVPEVRVESLLGDLRREYGAVTRNLMQKLESLGCSRKVKDPGEHKLVLVVDDDRGTRLTITHTLEAAGLLTEQASNGQQAIEKFIQFSPDLIIMDAIMPIKDGFEASKEIKQLPNGRRTEILIITGLENDESVELAFQCGAADFIPKPIN